MCFFSDPLLQSLFLVLVERNTTTTNYAPFQLYSLGPSTGKFRPAPPCATSLQASLRRNASRSSGFFFSAVRLKFIFSTDEASRRSLGALCTSMGRRAAGSKRFFPPFTRRRVSPPLFFRAHVGRLYCPLRLTRHRRLELFHPFSLVRFAFFFLFDLVPAPPFRSEDDSATTCPLVPQLIECMVKLILSICSRFFI